jgi:hypothetical protein
LRLRQLITFTIMDKCFRATWPFLFLNRFLVKELQFQFAFRCDWFIMPSAMKLGVILDSACPFVHPSVSHPCSVFRTFFWIK